MNTYVALLRGINVSGQKKIKMAELRPQIEALGFAEVQTYIQSGNIIFRTEQNDRRQLASQIKAKILADYGFEVPVLVLQAQDLKYVLDHNPFATDPEKDSKRWYLTFLAEPPAAELVEALKLLHYEPEEYVIDGSNIFFYSPQGYGRAKMNNNFFEKKLQVAATTRNWKTVNKLWEMCQ